MSIWTIVVTIYFIYPILKESCHNCIECPSKTPKKEWSFIQDLNLIYQHNFNEAIDTMFWPDHYGRKLINEYCTSCTVYHCEKWVFDLPLIISTVSILIFLIWAFQAGPFTSENSENK